MNDDVKFSFSVSFHCREQNGDRKTCSKKQAAAPELLEEEEFALIGVCRSLILAHHVFQVEKGDGQGDFGKNLIEFIQKKGEYSKEIVENPELRDKVFYLRDPV